ncbi:hypothetical protein KAR91_01960 [Candidatus Pacearchaeota archaeon]|nr:hypothetical protein [Candidatus Pacearchaeota archaeon]
MNKIKDMQGQRFGKLVVLSRAGSNAKQEATWKVRCDCSNERIVRGMTLRSGGLKNCGCARRDPLQVRMSSDKAGKDVRHPLYPVFHAMKRRCYNEASSDYYKYGERGITICEDWRDDPNSFVKWGISHGWEKGLQVDRVDNNGNYSPENCRFVTAKENCRNTRRNVWVKYKGQDRLLFELGEEFGIDRKILYDRVKRYKWDIEKALSTPVKVQHIKKPL